MIKSPERDYSRRSIVHKLILYIFKPVFVLTYYLKLFYWKKNRYTKSLNWNFDKSNFNRIALCNYVLSKIENPSFLEIGCNDNALFNSIPLEDKVGVDPLKGGSLRLTSDDFFSTNTKLFDVIFIDGLHTHQQVRNDIINSLKFLKPNGVIAIHDMLPSNWIEQHIPIVSRGCWTGDVWKIAFELSQTHGIDFSIVQIDMGIGIIKVKDINVIITDLSEELKSKQFEYFYNNISRLRIINWYNFCKSFNYNKK